MEFELDVMAKYTVQDLPDLVLTMIMSYLPLYDRINANDVCRHWKSFIRNNSSLWREVHISENTPYSDGWRRTNLRELDSGQFITDLDEFILQLANTTDLIQSFSLSCSVSLECDDFALEMYENCFKVSLHHLLVNQLKLLSLRLYLPSGERFNNQVIFDIVERHQNSLECLYISGAKIPMKSWQTCLTRGNFPNLKSISYPYPWMPILSDDEDEKPIQKESLIRCFEQTLKGGKVEEINMDIYFDNKEDFPSHWNRSFAESLKSQIKQGKGRNLRKLLLDSISSSATFGWPIAETNEEVDILIRNCPNLTHLKCHGIFFRFDDRWEIQGEPFITLLMHYNSQLVMLECGISDELAEVISCFCPNLSSLNFIGEHELSNKGLFALSKLSKLQHLRLIIGRMINSATPHGVISLLANSIIKLKTLELVLPYDFFLEIEIYSVICKNDLVLSSLKLYAFENFHECSDADKNYVQNRGKPDLITFIDGLIKILEVCPPLTHFYARIDHLRRLINTDESRCNSETSGMNTDESRCNSEISRIKDLLDTIVKHQPHLERLNLNIPGATRKDCMECFVEMLPHCLMTFDI